MAAPKKRVFRQGQDAPYGGKGRRKNRRHKGGTKPPQKKQAAWTSPAMQTRDGNLLLSKFQEPQISRLLRKQERKRQYGYAFAACHIQGVGLLRCIA
uniref:Uncharacterized protein n=1 Tax=Eubacterium plexicaudatum ASF492 TaxID=1235802 RepID=N2BD05_9FIRM